MLSRKTSLFRISLNKAVALKVDFFNAYFNSDLDKSALKILNPTISSLTLILIL